MWSKNLEYHTDSDSVSKSFRRIRLATVRNQMLQIFGKSVSSKPCGQRCPGIVWEDMSRNRSETYFSLGLFRLTLLHNDAIRIRRRTTRVKQNEKQTLRFGLGKQVLANHERHLSHPFVQAPAWGPETGAGTAMFGAMWRRCLWQRELRKRERQRPQWHSFGGPIAAPDLAPARP